MTTIKYTLEKNKIKIVDIQGEPLPPPERSSFWIQCINHSFAIVMHESYNAKLRRLEGFPCRLFVVGEVISCHNFYDITFLLKELLGSEFCIEYFEEK